MKRKLEFIFSWLLIMTVSAFLLWSAAKGIARFDKWIRKPKYDILKPVNYDQPKDTGCKPVKWKVEYIYIDGNLDTMSGNSSETDSIAPCVVSRTWYKNIYWLPIYNHSELKPLGTAE